MASWGDSGLFDDRENGVDWRSLLEIVLAFVLLTGWAALWLR